MNSIYIHIFKIISLSILLSLINVANAKGNLIARCEKLDGQVLGVDDSGFEVKNSVYKIETGKCYKLTIHSTGKHEYILEGADFFSNIFIRKLDIGKIELKINSLHSIDFDDEVSAKLYFLPVKPGKYTIYDKYMSDKGTQFVFEIE